MTPETALVLRLCRTPLPESSRSSLEQLLNRPVDWSQVFSLARGWQVEPVVMGNISRYFGAQVPVDILANVRERERDSRALTLGHTLALGEMSRTFVEKGIPVMVLKGPAVGVTGYGDPSLRSFADFDFLVHRRDLARARELVVSMGYDRGYSAAAEKGLIQKQHALEFSRATTKVELHWGLLSRHLRFTLDLGEAWRESRLIDCAGREIRVLAPHHQFLFVCAHGTKHMWVSPHWICDVAQLAERLDQAAVAEVLGLAERLHAKRILSLSIRVAESLVGLDPSPFPDELLAPDSEIAPLASRIVAQFSPPDHAVPPAPGRHRDPNLTQLLFWISNRERAIDRVMSLAHVLLVPTDKDAGSGAAAWLRRPFRLAARALKNAASPRGGGTSVS